MTPGTKLRGWLEEQQEEEQVEQEVVGVKHANLLHMTQQNVGGNVKFARNLGTLQICVEKILQTKEHKELQKVHKFPLHLQQHHQLGRPQRRLQPKKHGSWRKTKNKL